jgi:hypothetical protein
MMVLLLKQMHLQNEVAVDLALRVGCKRERMRRSSGRGERVRCMLASLIGRL